MERVQQIGEICGAAESSFADPVEPQRRPSGEIWYCSHETLQLLISGILSEHMSHVVICRRASYSVSCGGLRMCWPD